MRSVSREGLDGGRDAAPNYIRLPALTSIFSVEPPGIEPAPGIVLTCGNAELDYAKQREMT
jgi:hypothetical protein